jgi:hypothetical protein
MITIRATVTLAGALSLLGRVSPVFAASACAALENKNAEARLEYLQGDRSLLDKDCILYAIERFGNERYSAAVKTLVGYLDYRNPDPPLVPKRLTPTAYPAVEALFQIGKSAIPDVVEVIADAATSDLVRNNAGDAVFAIYRADPAEGIAVMVRAAHATTDPMASLRLMDQARRQATRCGPQWRNDCENATLK